MWGTGPAARVESERGLLPTGVGCPHGGAVHLLRKLLIFDDAFCMVHCFTTERSNCDNTNQTTEVL